MAANPQIAHEVPHISSTEETAPVIRRTPAELANIVSLIASSHGWVERVRFRTEERWYERIYHSRDYDIWVISWLPGQSTGFHDHGASSGAFAIATGTLEELRPGQKARIVNAGQSRTFGPDYSHDVRNVSGAPAVSIHAYSPPLSEMNEYEMEGSRLVVRQRSSERVARLDPGWPAQNGKPIDAEPVKSIEQVLTATRTRLRRLSPLEAHEAMHGEGAVLVDIRPESQRLVEGRIEGALVVERNVLELVGIKAPEEIRGIRQQPIEGFSFADSINDAHARWHHTTQYYYIFGSRSIYDDGWKAELAYPNDILLKDVQSNPPLDESAWELYNLKEDPTERIDLAKKNPEKLAQLKAEYEEQAQAHHLYPYITFDDMREKRLQHTYLPAFIKAQQLKNDNAKPASSGK
jgi:mannose-6-phosphate isomerase-like protein (cupin superfamily)